MIRWFLAVLLPSLIGCQTTVSAPDKIPEYKPNMTLNQYERWNTLVGKWYGEQQTNNGGIMKWIVERNNDASSQITFRSYDQNGSFTESVEVGKWAISGPIYFTSLSAYVDLDGTTQKVDPSDPYNYDAYQIIELNTLSFTYKHIEGGHTFSVKKVPDWFDFK